MIFLIAEYGSDDYRMMVDLRYRILRKPLGLIFTDKDLDQDKSDILCIGKSDDKVIACCILSPLGNGTIKFRQMAVDQDKQGMRLGKQMLNFAEQVAREKCFLQVVLHARKVAVEFYLKAGYKIIGDEFVEVGIPHFEMKKDLRPI